MFHDLGNTCVLCATKVRRAGTKYRGFLLEPGTLVTLASGLLLIVAFILSPGGLLGGRGAERNALLYLPSALVGSAYIWWSAIQGIRAKDFTADIPVSLATIGAIAIGEYAAAAVVAVLLLLGGLLESFVAARAGHALEALARLLPERVTVRRPDGDVVVPLAEVQPGDVLLVRAGERIAIDGEVTGGSALVNEAAITGESVPLEKQPGDEVFAGTLSESGAMEVQATRVGGDTTLGQIRRMIAEAQSQQAPIERLLDRYAKLYTPAALILGALLWWWTGDIMRAITVLIVFCPCVMVLATPTALVAAVGNAALRGNLIKQGATIEALAQVDTIVFDKTGTLTVGEPKLVEIVCLDGIDERELLQLSASAELFSEHPFGRATVSAARERGLPLIDPTQYEARPGRGVAACVDGADVALGHSDWLEERGVDLVPAVHRRLAAEGHDGATQSRLP